MTATLWLLVAGMFLGGLVGAYGAGGTDGRQLGSAFLLALLLWCAVGLGFMLYGLILGG
jgi:hypothetical protein